MGQTSLADLQERRGFDIGEKTLAVFRECNLFSVQDVRKIEDDDFAAQIADAIARICPRGGATNGSEMETNGCKVQESAQKVEECKCTTI